MVIVAGAFYMDFSRATPSHYESSNSILVAGMIIFVAYEHGNECDMEYVADYIFSKVKLMVGV